MSTTTSKRKREIDTDFSLKRQFNPTFLNYSAEGQQQQQQQHFSQQLLQYSAANATGQQMDHTVPDFKRRKLMNQSTSSAEGPSFPLSQQMSAAAGLNNSWFALHSPDMLTGGTSDSSAAAAANNASLAANNGSGISINNAQQQFNQQQQNFGSLFSSASSPIFSSSATSSTNTPCSFSASNVKSPFSFSPAILHPNSFSSSEKISDNQKQSNNHTQQQQTGENYNSASGHNTPSFLSTPSTLFGSATPQFDFSANDKQQNDASSSSSSSQYKKSTSQYQKPVKQEPSTSSSSSGAQQALKPVTNEDSNLNYTDLDSSVASRVSANQQQLLQQQQNSSSNFGSQHFIPSSNGSFSGQDSLNSSHQANLKHVYSGPGAAMQQAMQQTIPPPPPQYAASLAAEIVHLNQLYHLYVQNPFINFFASSTPVCMLKRDTEDAVILSCNDAFAAILGKQHSQVVKRKASELQYQDYMQPFDNHFANSLAAELRELFLSKINHGTRRVRLGDRWLCETFVLDKGVMYCKYEPVQEWTDEVSFNSSHSFEKTMSIGNSNETEITQAVCAKRIFNLVSQC